MKRLILLVSLIIASVSDVAQGRATLRVSLTTNRMVAVTVDDRYYERRGNILTVGDIPSGQHYLKVYNYRIGRNGNGKANLVYSGYVNLRPNTFNNAVIDPYQRMMRMRTRPIDGNYRMDDHHRDHMDDRGDNMPATGDDIYENWNDNNSADE